MNLEQQGVEVECNISADGTLMVNLITNRAIRVTVNGAYPSVPVAQQRATKTTFWQPDGTQGETPPQNLSGG
jgi:hypothetical protein